MIVDIGALAILLICFFRGIQRGFIKIIGRTLIFLATVILLFLFYKPTYNFAREVPLFIQTENTISQNIKSYVTQHVNGQYQTTSEAIDSLKFPTPVNTFLNGYCSSINNVIEDNVDVVVTSAVTELTMRILLGLCLFILLLIAVECICALLNVLSHLPIIHGTNKLLGGAFGLLNGLIILYIISFIIVALPIGNAIWLQQHMEGSLFKTWIYDNNILVHFLGYIKF